MKKIEELTEREILDLTDGDVKKMIKLLCAEEGVKIIGEPEAPKYADVPKEDVLAYRVSGVSYVFLNKNEAERVSALLNDSESRKDYSFFGDCRFMEIKDVKPTVSTQEARMYSPTLKKAVEPLIERNNEIRESHNKEFSEYNSEKEKRDVLSSRIWNRVKEVRNEYADMERLWNIYKNEYLTLTEDEALALAFLKKAYTVDSKTEFYIEDKLKTRK
jgi:hypothetical protein